MADISQASSDQSAFHGVDVETGWCKRYGYVCTGDSQCCSAPDPIKVVSLDYAQDVEKGLRIEVAKLKAQVSLYSEICRTNGWPEFSGSSDETSVAGVPATSEITSRSWDPKAAGRRAVDKHADALKRLSDQKGASDG